MIAIRPATTEADITQIATLAETIWREFYTPIIGSDQVEYMLEHFQSIAAMMQQIEEEDYRYFCIGDVGYLSVQVRDSTLFLSKIYLLASHRQQGLGRFAMEYVEQLARQAGCESIELTVNKHNPSLHAYERLGFVNEAEVVADIGNGFVMDDYRMRKRL